MEAAKQTTRRNRHDEGKQFFILVNRRISFILSRFEVQSWRPEMLREPLGLQVELAKKLALRIPKLPPGVQKIQPP